MSDRKMVKASELKPGDVIELMSDNSLIPIKGEVVFITNDHSVYFLGPRFGHWGCGAEHFAVSGTNPAALAFFQLPKFKLLQHNACSDRRGQYAEYYLCLDEKW